MPKLRRKRKQLQKLSINAKAIDQGDAAMVGGRRKRKRNSSSAEVENMSNEAQNMSSQDLVGDLKSSGTLHGDLKVPVPVKEKLVQHKWQSVVPLLVPGPKEFPFSTIEYMKFGKSKHNPWAMKVRQHLLFLGWKVEIYIYARIRRTMKYTTPNGIQYFSLLEVCEVINNNPSSGSSSDLKETKEKDSMSLTSRRVTRALDPLSKYLQNPKDSNFEEEARNRLSTLGWVSMYVNISGLFRWKYISPEGKNYYALRLACHYVISERSRNSDPPTPSIKSRKRKMMSSSKRTRATSRRVSCHPRTTFSLLISNNIVLPREKVYYYGKDNQTMAEGRITVNGIKCSCCQKIFSLSGFEAHAKCKSLNHHPATNIFLKDGRSLFKCQLQMLRDNVKEIIDVDKIQSANDDTCFVCGDGGELLLCGRCPSSVHTGCLGLQITPDGEWCCPSCCCGICGKIQSIDSQMNEKNTLCCDQCDRQFHISCLGDKGVDFGDYKKPKWFCCRQCSEIYKGLQELQSNPIPLTLDNLTWTLIKPMQYESGDQFDEGYAKIMAENHNKLNLALKVIKECFEPAKEPLTRRDLFEDVVFGRRSKLKRLNFTGFYIILLEKNDELISVATLRIHGGEVAEIPLVATRFHFRGSGMCRLLMNELEENLTKLGVEKLVLPSCPTTLNTWTNKFGFTEITPLQKSELSAYTFLDFQGAVMCQKRLR